MELEGFRKTVVAETQKNTIIDYSPKNESSWKCLRLQKDDKGNIVLRLLEGGASPEISTGERTSSPVSDDTICTRLLNAMAVHHFGANWLGDGYTPIDVEMISRGFEVGKYPSGEMLWFKNANNTIIVVKRDKSSLLPASFSDEVILQMKGPSGTELSVVSADFESALAFMDADAHFQLYNPYVNVEVAGIHAVKGQTRH